MMGDTQGRWIGKIIGRPCTWICHDLV